MNNDEPADLLFAEREDREKGFAIVFESDIKPKLADIETSRVAAVMAGEAERFRGTFKRTVIPEILKFAGALTYDPDDGIVEAALYASKLFDEIQGIESEDLITGETSGLPFQWSEVRSGAVGGFRGFVVMVDLLLERGEIGTETLILAVRDKRTAGNLFERWVRAFDKEKQVSFDNAEFERDFEVYANEARALVTAKLIRCISELGELTGASGIEFAMVWNQFLLKVETQDDLFEPSDVNRSALNTEDCRRILAEIHKVLEIVDTLAEGIKAEAG